MIQWILWSATGNVGSVSMPMHPETGYFLRYQGRIYRVSMVTYLSTGDVEGETVDVLMADATEYIKFMALNCVDVLPQISGAEPAPVVQ